jgi:hypothetical protein
VLVRNPLGRCALKSWPGDLWRQIIAGIQLADRRDDLVSIASPSKSRTTGVDVKCPRSLKQFTLTTARAPIVVSETAAMKTPQRREMRKSQARAPKR